MTTTATPAQTYDAVATPSVGPSSTVGSSPTSSLAPAADRLPCLGWSDPRVPPPTLRVGHVLKDVTTGVMTVPLRTYVEVALASTWPADAPAVALEAAAVAIRQAAWFRAMEPTFNEGVVDGACFDVPDDLSGQPYRPAGPIAATYVQAVQAAWSLVLRKANLELPFFQPRFRLDSSEVCGPAVAPLDTVLPQGGVIACARDGMSVAQILHHYMDPDLAIYDIGAAPPIEARGKLLDAWIGLREPWGVTLTDAQGIPQVVYSGVATYNAVQISQWGLAHYQAWLETGADSARRIFLATSDWLVRNQQGDGRWLYSFEFAGQPDPWWSGMAEGVAMSLLLRAYQVTGHHSYLAAATNALSTMTRTIGKGGVVDDLGGFLWIEEYLPPYSRHTLNGMLFATEGVREYALVTGDPTAARIASQAIQTVIAWLPRFDSGSWTYYNQSPSTEAGKAVPGKPATFHYHLIQLGELRHFYQLTGSPVLFDYIARWANDAAHPPGG